MSEVKGALVGLMMILTLVMLGMGMGITIGKIVAEAECVSTQETAKISED